MLAGRLLSNEIELTAADKIVSQWQVFHVNSILVLQPAPYGFASAWDLNGVGSMDTGVRVPSLGVWLLSSAWFVIFLWGSFGCLFHASRTSRFFWRCCRVHIACDGEDVCAQVTLISFALRKGDKLSTIFKTLLPLSSYIPLGKKAGILTGFKTSQDFLAPFC